MFLTLYDYSTCFDSLWLEDTMLSLWDLGIRDEMFPLIHKMNEQALITIRTPYGLSNEFSCPSIVKQGCVLSTNLCGSATGQLINELDVTEDCGATVGSALIKGVMFVDDTTTVNSNPIGSHKSNEVVSSFSHRKRLDLNKPKCVQLCVNLRKSEPPPALFLDDQLIENVKSSKCVGDIYATNGSKSDLVAERVKKGQGVTVSSLSLCNDITLGQHHVKSSLILYKCVFLASLLFNSSAWSNITQGQFEDLETAQTKHLKRIMQAPNSTSNCLTFLELGILPIKFEVHRRQLMYLHHILHVEPDAPMPLLYEQQSLFTYEPNWANTTKKLLVQYNLQEIDIKSKTKDEWKLLVDTLVCDVAFTTLKNISSTKSKTYQLSYTTFEPQSYLFETPGDVASFVFRLRGHILNCRNNHHKAHPILTCRSCGVEIETQEHIINCRNVFAGESHLCIESLYHDKPQINVNFIRKVMERYDTFHGKKSL